ncbi:uncharacterized protein LOC100925754 isoform X2 [Sarcophilus harrisii]|uniref:uncharacterized protein LOC100925754 isoform X2 n=1 Tax=Sarcophilus harrisii TaxID=9305 RepID=UPI000C7CD4F0|nr:uncharacterized protein LOC100925754 isoform X2 [Sarcophilus harrisii]
MIKRNQYDWLIEEGKSECFDERRINLLKAQVMQLQRQVVLLTEGLSSRAALLLELNEALNPLSQKLRSFLDWNSPTCEVPVARSELKQMIKMCHTLQSKLQKNYQTTGIEELALPWLMSRKNCTKPTVTLLDLCYGKMDNLNLQYVSALETKLSQLYRHLHGMRQTLNFILAPGQGSHKQSLQILPTAVYSRLINQMKRCNHSLEECCSDLLILTLVVPSAPWAKIQNASIPEFTVDSVLAILPTFPKGAPQEKAKKAVGALLKATNYSKLMTTQQINALQAEVNFHRSIYDLQIKYTKDVFDAIKHIYHSFLANIDGILCSPLKDVLSSYINLTLEPSDTAFKHFLYVLKNNAGPIQEAVDTLTPSENLQHEGEEALSKFGRELFLSLEQALRDCAEQRDKAARETEFLRIELEQAITELHLLKKERKEKGTESSLRFSKWKGEGGGVLGTEDPPTQFGSQKPRLVVNSIFSNKAENSRASSLQPQEETSEKAPLHHRGKNFRIKSIKPTRLSLQD